MWNAGECTEAEAAAAFALSSPEESEFSASPAGHALREARLAHYESVAFAAFEESPVPEKEILADCDSLIEPPLPFDPTPKKCKVSLFPSSEDKEVLRQKQILFNIASSLPLKAQTRFKNPTVSLLRTFRTARTTRFLTIATTGDLEGTPLPQQMLLRCQPTRVVQ